MVETVRHFFDDLSSDLTPPSLSATVWYGCILRIPRTCYWSVGCHGAM